MDYDSDHPASTHCITFPTDAVVNGTVWVKDLESKDEKTVLRGEF